MSKSNGKLTVEEFTKRAIEKLRKPPYKGIHTVISGFNGAFREYFGADPVAATKALAEKGVIVSHPARHGAMLYLPGEAPKPVDKSGKEALAKLGL